MPASKTMQHRPVIKQKSAPKEDTNKVIGITSGELIQKEYTSHDLGIRFKYIACSKKIIDCKITWEGNKVSVCGDRYVEIFNKNSNESLKQTVKKQFSKNYPPNGKIQNIAQLTTVK